MKLALRVGSKVVTVVLGIIMLLTMYCAVSSRINGGTPSVFGYQMYEVLSGSMEPKIHTGSVILDRPHVDTKGLKVGDVITFTVPHVSNIIVTHRIAEVTTDAGQPAFVTKGDANDSKDSWKIPASNIIGEYSNVTIPYLGYYLNFMKTKMGISLLLIIPGALLILTTVVSMFREIAKLQRATTTKAPSDNLATDGSDVKA